MTLSVIIPNYNGEDLLVKNLPYVLDALSDYKNRKAEILIADDCSTDKSREVINKFKKTAENRGISTKVILNNEKKLRGFSKNVNRAIKEASGDILILLNTDVAPYKNFINPLISHFSDIDVFAVGCMDESYENGKKILRGRGVGNFKRGFLMHARGEVNRDDSLWVSGGSGAFRKSIWDQIGGFDDIYDPFYWEDIDLSYRAQKAGFKIRFERKSIVEHLHEKGIIKKKYGTKMVRRIAYRNQFIFVWKNVTDINLLLAHIFWLPYHIFKSLLRNDLEFFNGFFAAIKQCAKINKSRICVKKQFRKTDAEVLKPFNK